ncbi:unnamed protein product [Arctia plantaginis]|uniref:Zinc finger PHD-type domain-containing protein n=1 Tax=Arctia plantaginis TaxID=874455 RepID=A0A8S0YXQ4_ARCPL|nr:unnamed protein product [Arctia plantaginis]
MKRCAAECTIDLNTEDYMECTRCRDAYHYVCLNLSPTEVASLDQDIKRSWSCPRCFSKQPKGGNIDLPVRPSIPTSTADVTFNVTRRKVQQRPESLQMTTPHSDFVLRTELRELIREEMRNVVKECITDLNITLKENLQAMREQISSFKDSLNFMSDQYDNLHKTVEECRTNLISLSKENESLRSDNIKLSNKLSLLDQASRASNLEILCVPEKKSENVMSIVKQLGRAVNCNINDNEILYCSRTAKINPTNARPRSILVKLSSPRTRDMLLSSVASIYVRKSETTHTVHISNLDILNKLV